MKKQTKLITQMAVVAALSGSLTLSNAKESTFDSSNIKQQLTSVSRLELPATAAKLVVSSQGEDRTQATETIVGTAVGLNPMAASVIVSSVSRLSPDMAPVAAATAAGKQPKQAREIAKAASAVAPTQAGKIVSAMCKALPSEYRGIAAGVAESVPGMDKSLISSVIEALPTLQPFYQRTVDTFASATWTPSASVFLDQIAKDVEISATALKTSGETLLASGVDASQTSLLPPPPAQPPPPIVRPPFTGLGGSPGEINRTSTTNKPPQGNRPYSTP